MMDKINTNNINQDNMNNNKKLQKSKFKNLLFNLKRLSFDLPIAILLLLLFSLNLQQYLPQSAQLVYYKMLLVSIAITHAHITRKLLLPKVSWFDDKIRPIHIVTILLYLVFIYVYAF